MNMHERIMAGKLFTDMCEGLPEERDGAKKRMIAFNLTTPDRLTVSTEAMKHWAVEHANIVRVLSPESLVDEIRAELKKAISLYNMD